MKRERIFIAALGALLLISALATAGAFAAAPQTITISEKEFSLTPNTFTVQVGQPVQFQVTNNGTIQHNLKVELPAKSIAMQLFNTNLNPGETKTAEFTFTEVGDWQVYCPVDGHKDAGMKGVIHVVATSSGAAPTAQATSTTSSSGSISAAKPEATSSTNAGGSATPAAPSTLPTTGGGSPSALQYVILAGLMLVSAGLAIRRRLTTK